MKIYISRPITIDPEHWREHFADAEETLRRKYPDAEIINPLTLEDDPAYIEAQEHLEGEELYDYTGDPVTSFTLLEKPVKGSYLPYSIDEIAQEIDGTLCDLREEYGF